MPKIIRINNATHEITILRDDGVKVDLVVPSERISDKQSFIQEEIVKLEQKVVAAPVLVKVWSPIAITIIAIETVAIVLLSCHVAGVL